MGLFDRLATRGQRVVFLGIDGVPFSLIENEPDIFENLTEMMETGTASPIDSVLPPESSACWPALTTGKSPGKTGVYGFQERKADSYDTYVPTASHVQEKRIWDRVTESGRNATVLNVPVTYPPDRRLQRMVSGFLSPNIESAASPKAITETLEAHSYRIDVNARLGHQDDKSPFFENAEATLTARYQTFLHFIEQDDWDLFFGVFMTTDRVNHFAFEDYENDGDYREAFLDFYRRLDTYIGKLRDEMPDDVPLVIASDHGFTTLTYEVDLNAWLRENELLAYDRTDPERLSHIAADSKAYALVPGRIYLNSTGREPAGSVTEGEYSQIRAEIKDELASLRGPDGRRVIDRVVEREVAFDGDPQGSAPDLIAIPRDGYDLKAGFDTSAPIFDTGPRNGMHTFENATLIVDEPVSIPADPDLLAIAPLLSDLLDLPADADRAESPIESPKQ